MSEESLNRSGLYCSLECEGDSLRNEETKSAQSAFTVCENAVYYFTLGVTVHAPDERHLGDVVEGA